MGLAVAGGDEAGDPEEGAFGLGIGQVGDGEAGGLGAGGVHGVGEGGGTLTCTGTGTNGTTFTPTSGVATATGCSITPGGTGYTLTATSSGLSTATRKPPPGNIPTARMGIYPHMYPQPWSAPIVA